jgi:hypothetical protein
VTVLTHEHDTVMVQKWQNPDRRSHRQHGVDDLAAVGETPAILA